ncbi:MAG: 16S rRNA (cytosine(1402)-N(4))-methyltransferase RsmH [Planctomycetaceae bacterium]
MSERPVHVSVMPREVLHYLQISEGLTVVDGTVGAGGHSQLILRQLGDTGTLIGFDRDAMMLRLATPLLRKPNVILVQSSYSLAREALAERNITSVDRVLLDLGLSSDQLADRTRGFGFDAGGPLDMRFDTQLGQPAGELLNTADRSRLIQIFREFGEEPFAERIADRIVTRRKQGGLQTAQQLEECIRAAVPDAAIAKSSRNPATRVFQALRIAVNQELQHLQHMMTDVLPQIMTPGGIVVVLAFHSLEDRIVKSAFKGHQGWQVLTKTPVEATPAEIRLNPRSRSARLRAARWKPAA